jgi:hypothetical protein
MHHCNPKSGAKRAARTAATPRREFIGNGACIECGTHAPPPLRRSQCRLLRTNSASAHQHGEDSCTSAKPTTSIPTHHAHTLWVGAEDRQRFHADERGLLQF